MKNLDKKSNADLNDLKFKLSQDFELLRKELIVKHRQWLKIKEVYGEVIKELKNRNLE
jgi:hypothetical protein